MRISDLSRRSGVPVATIKFYLRENLLPPGELIAATQARYDEAHLVRLALIRALLGPARLSVEAARRVLLVIDHPPENLHEVLGAAQEATAGPSLEVDSGPARAWMERLGWAVDENSPELSQLTVAMQAIHDSGIDLVPGGLERYAAVAHDLAEQEISTVPSAGVDASVRQAVLGTVLIEPLLLALRRLALQDVSAHRFRAVE